MREEQQQRFNHGHLVKRRDGIPNREYIVLSRRFRRWGAGWMYDLQVPSTGRRIQGVRSKFLIDASEKEVHLKKGDIVRFHDTNGLMNGYSRHTDRVVDWVSDNGVKVKVEGVPHRFNRYRFKVIRQMVGDHFSEDLFIL